MKKSFSFVGFAITSSFCLMSMFNNAMAIEICEYRTETTDGSISYCCGECKSFGYFDTRDECRAENPFCYELSNGQYAGCIAAETTFTHVDEYVNCPSSAGTNVNIKCGGNNGYYRVKMIVGFNGYDYADCLEENTSLCRTNMRYIYTRNNENSVCSGSFYYISKIEVYKGSELVQTYNLTRNQSDVSGVSLNDQAVYQYDADTEYTFRAYCTYVQ